MRCQFCGRDNPEGYVYCTYCGTVLARPADLNTREIKEARQRLASIVAERQKTDRIISPLCIILPVIFAIACGIIGVAIMLSGLIDEMSDLSYDPYVDGYPDEALDGIVVVYIGSFTYQIILAFLTYLLITRLNRHFDRESKLRNEMISLIESGVKSRNLEPHISNEMYAIKNTEHFNEKRLEPAFWAIIIALPLVVNVLYLRLLFEAADGPSIGLVSLSSLFSLLMWIVMIYLLHILGKSIYAHDRRWNDFAYSSQRAMSKAGFPAGPSYDIGRLHERSTLLYVLLTFVTFGLFMNYWWYTLIKDPNVHFERQWHFEDSLLSVLGAR